jgi:hypothetical protein
VRCLRRQQQAHPPVAVAVLQGGNLQLLAHACALNAAEMRGRLAHAAHMLVGVHELAVVQAQGFEHLERALARSTKARLWCHSAHSAPPRHRR